MLLQLFMRYVPDISIIPSLSFKIALLIFWGILFVTCKLLTNLGSRELIVASASAENTPCVAKISMQRAPATLRAFNCNYET